MRHFIIVGANNFWCSNINVKGQTEEEIDAEIVQETERLKEDLSPENVPDEFLVYETKSDKTHCHVYNTGGNPAAE